jgi:hypothetical protein
VLELNRRNIFRNLHANLNIINTPVVFGWLIHVPDLNQPEKPESTEINKGTTFSAGTYQLNVMFLLNIEVLRLLSI